MSMDLCISIFHPRNLPAGIYISNERFSVPLTDGKPYFLIQFPNRSYAGHLTFITMGGYDCLILNDEVTFRTFMASLQHEIDSEEIKIIFDDHDKSKLIYCRGVLKQISNSAHQWYQENKILVVGYC